MKKLIALILSVALVAGLCGSTIAAPKKAVKKVAKKVVKPVKKAPAKAAPKAAPAPAAPWAPPAPAPATTPAPAPAPTPAPAPVSSSTTGMGITLGGNVGLDAGLMGVAGNLDYDLTGLGLAGAKVRVGGNYISGTNPTGSTNVKAVSLKVGAIYNVTEYLKVLGLPLTYYVGGAYLLPVKVSGGVTGKWGAEAYLGMNYMIPGMGEVNGEIGYGALKYSDAAAALKGVDLKVGYRMDI